MTMSLVHKIPLVVFLTVSAMAGQQTLTRTPTPTPEQWETISNKGRLEISFALDRKQYLPGEVGIFTVTVRNPGPVALRVQPPFDSSNGIDLMQKGTPAAKEFGADYWYVSPHPYCLRPSNPFHPPIVIGPGELLTKKMSSLEGDSGGIRFNNRTVPSRPGQYRAVFSYDPRHHFDFEVVPAAAVVHRWVALPDERLPGRPGEPEQLSHRKVVAFIARSGDEQFLCVSADYVRGGKWLLKPGESLSDFRNGYTRVRKLDSPALDLELTVDDAERVSIHWSTVEDGTVVKQRREVRMLSSRTR